MRMFRSSPEPTSSPQFISKSLADLSPELVLKILDHLSYNDIIQVKKSCRRLYLMIEEQLKRVDRPWIRMDLSPSLNAGVPVVKTKFCRTNTKPGAPYIFSLYQLNGRIELSWSKGNACRQLTLNGSSESCNRLMNKSIFPPAQIAREFLEEVSTFDEALRRMLRAHLKKAHVKELNFRYLMRPIRRSELDVLQGVLKETNSKVYRVYFGSLDPLYKEVVQFTHCWELSVQANNQKVDILGLTLPKILIYGDGGITVDILIAFTKQWESGQREIEEFRHICDLEVAQIKDQLRELASFMTEESSRTILSRSIDNQRLVVNIEHNSLQMYSK